MQDLQKPFANEGYALMGAAFEVHNVMGGGLLEEIYQQSLEIELSLRDIPFRRKAELAVFYKGRQLQKKYIPDLVVFDRIVVELKAVRALDPEHEAQLINYGRAILSCPTAALELPRQRAVKADISNRRRQTCAFLTALLDISLTLGRSESCNTNGSFFRSL